MPAFGDSCVTTHCAGNEAKITGGDNNESLAPRLVSNWLAADATAKFKSPEFLARGCVQGQGLAKPINGISWKGCVVTFPLPPSWLISPSI